MPPEKALPLETLLPFNTNYSPPNRPALDADWPPSDHFNDHSQSPDSQEDDDNASGSNQKPKRQKRSRACVACRNMKIRCLPIEGQESCSACSKVNRQCIMPGPPRKRQKTVHKVAELEKKINALTDALLAKHQPSDVARPGVESPLKEASTNSSSEPPRSEDTPNTSIDFHARGIMDRAFPPTTQPRFTTGCEVANYEPVAKDNYVDVVDRGDLSMESATAMFCHWRDNMCFSNPYVVFPPGTCAQEVRTTRPITFLTILAAASAVVLPSAQPALTIEVNRQLSERVLFHGDKSLDLIQALLLNSQYYVRPRTARDLAFNQNIQAANIMALELGIGKRSTLKRRPEEEVELCRTWLGCYQATISVTTILRLPSLVRFTPRIEECLQTLATSPHALDSDKWVCATVGLSRIAEDVSAAFEMDDPGADLKFAEPRIQYQLKGFQRQLGNWEKAIDFSVDPRLVRHHAACLSLYINEIAIHQDHNVDDFRPAADQQEAKLPDVVTASHIGALSNLLTSSHQVLDTYLSLDCEHARTLTNLHIVWNAYAIVVLIKLHWIINSPNSKFAAVFVPDLKTDHYLDAILNRLGEVSAGGKSPCAAAFGFVFMKLKIWHLHRTAQLSDDDQGGPQNDQTRHQRASDILRKDPAQIMSSVKRIPWEMEGLPTSLADATEPSVPTPRPFTPAYLPFGSWNNVERAGPNQGLNLTAAYDVTNYGNTNWDQFNFSTEELDMFDAYMNNAGWMGYLL